jgi:hypothetical protein
VRLNEKDEAETKAGAVAHYLLTTCYLLLAHYMLLATYYSLLTTNTHYLLFTTY